MKMKKIWIILAIVVLTAICTTLLLVLIPKPEKVQGENTKEPEVSIEPVGTYSYDIDSAFVTNMKDSTRFVRASISLVLNSEEDISILENNIYIVRDRIIAILRGTTEEEYLDNTSQEDLRYKIKEELGLCLDIGSIEEVYFTELVVQ